MHTQTTHEIQDSYFSECSSCRTSAEFIEYRLATSIRSYATLVICVLGICGNVLCILVLCRRGNRKVTCYVYFGAIAVADSILLLNAGWYQCMVDLHPDSLTKGLCQLTNSLWFGSAFASTYILFFATLER